MRNHVLGAALLALLALGSTGCVLFLDEGLVGFGCSGLGKPFSPRGSDYFFCSCAIFCELGGPGGSLLGDCFEGSEAQQECLPFSRGPRGAVATYSLPPDAYFALGSYAAGAATSHQVGLTAPAGGAETFSAVITYPGSFVFNGFAAGPVGSLGVDFNADGVVDADVPVIGQGGDTAFADFDEDGAYGAATEPAVTHSGTHVFTVALPAGGDRNLMTVMAPVPIGLVLTLLPGVLDNPAAAGPYLIEGDFTSVDPDTDGADDAAGTAPQMFAADEMVEIGEGPCPAEPAPGCNATFAKGSLQLKDGTGDKDALRVKAKKGAAPEGFFGDPTDATSHATCVYDGTGALILELPVAAGGTGANGKPLWKLKKQKATYKDKVGTAGGVRKVGERSGKGAGFDVSASGANLALPMLPVQAPVTVQHRTLDGGCGQIVFDTLSKNDATQVKGTVK
jgi:hypothetical protein